MSDGTDVPTDPGQGPAPAPRRKVHVDPQSGRVEGVITLWGVSVPAQFAVDLARSFGVNTIAVLAVIGFLLYRVLPELQAVQATCASLQVSMSATQTTTGTVEARIGAVERGVADVRAEVAELRGGLRARGATP